MGKTRQDQSTPSPKKKDGTSSDSLRLTPSEIQSLRKHKRSRVSPRAQGKFKHLFQDEPMTAARSTMTKDKLPEDQSSLKESLENISEQTSSHEQSLPYRCLTALLTEQDDSESCSEKKLFSSILKTEDSSNE